MLQLEKVLSRISDTKALLIEEGALAKVPGLFRSIFGDAKGVVVTGSNTFVAAGSEVDTRMREAGIEMEEPFVFDRGLSPEWSYMEKLEARLKTTEAVPVAVGGGVICDLTKIASTHCGKKFIMVATASSMDGDTACGASIVYNGNKRSFDSSAPCAMVIDLSVVSKAPKGMSSAGYADLLAKVTASADWVLADSLGVDPIEPFAFGLVRGNLSNWLSDPEGVANGELEAMRQLSEGLSMSGFAMQKVHSSRPASGLDHQFSHYWEMRGLRYEGRMVSHGFKVALGTLLSTATLEFFLEQDFSTLNIPRCIRRYPSVKIQRGVYTRLFSDCKCLIDRAERECPQKYPPRYELERELTILRDDWPHIRARLRDYVLPFDDVKDRLKRAGAPYEPEMIGLSNADMKETFLCMPYMTRRFTSIDILYRTGLVESASEYIFGQSGIWPC